MSNTYEPERLDPRVRRTRGLIEAAFRALLAERSYAEITVADIAAKATVNRATFYLHFEDKEHLATSMMQEELDTALCARLDHGGMPLTVEALGGIAEVVYDFFERRIAGYVERDKELAPTLMAVLQETVQTLVRKWLDLDEKAMDHFPGGTKDDVATVVAWALYGGASRWSHLRQRPPAAEAARRIVRLLIRSEASQRVGRR
jgi:AcrR family transcriptional regulator